MTTQAITDLLQSIGIIVLAAIHIRARVTQPRDWDDRW